MYPVIATREVCTSAMSDIHVSGRRHGYLSAASLAQLSSRLADVQSASVVGLETSGVQGGAQGGTKQCPWTVNVQQGQRINVSLIVLPARTTLTSRRDAFVDVYDDVISRSVLILFPVTWFCFQFCITARVAHDAV